MFSFVNIVFAFDLIGAFPILYHSSRTICGVCYSFLKNLKTKISQSIITWISRSSRSRLCSYISRFMTKYQGLVEAHIMIKIWSNRQAEKLSDFTVSPSSFDSLLWRIWVPHWELESRCVYLETKSAMHSSFESKDVKNSNQLTWKNTVLYYIKLRIITAWQRHPRAAPPRPTSGGSIPGIIESSNTIKCYSFLKIIIYAPITRPKIPLGYL